MGPGITLVVLGAILTFAVRADSEVIDLQVAGVIFMLAGGAIIAHARRTRVDERVVTQVEEDGDPERPTHSVEERTVRRSVHGEHGIQRR